MDRDDADNMRSNHRYYGGQCLSTALADIRSAERKLCTSYAVLVQSERDAVIISRVQRLPGLFAELRAIYKEVDGLHRGIKDDVAQEIATLAAAGE